MTMAATSRSFENDMSNMYIAERGDSGVGYSVTSTPSHDSPTGMQLTHHVQNVATASKPPTPQRCEIEIPGRFKIQIHALGKKINVRHTGVPQGYRPGVLYPSSVEDASPDLGPIQSITYHRPGSPSRQVYTSPQGHQSVNRRALLPGTRIMSPDSTIHYDYPSPSPSLIASPPPSMIPSNASSPAGYYEDEDYMIPMASPKRMAYGSVPSPERVVLTSYTQAVRPRPASRSPEDGSITEGTPRIIPIQHIDRGGQVRVGGSSPSPIMSPVSDRYSAEPRYPVGVRSQLLYTAPTQGMKMGYVQSRPANSEPAPAVSPPLQAHTDMQPPTTHAPPPPVSVSTPPGTPNQASTPTSPARGYESSPSLLYMQQTSTPTRQIKSAGQPVAQTPKTSTPLADNHSDQGQQGSPKAKEAEIDALTNLLVQNMEAAADPDFYGMCGRCGRAIMGENQGCSALDQLYHLDCFVCLECNSCLGGQPFFAMEGKPHCEPCYLNTLEKCSVCSKAITDRILRATGKPYHPSCFMCVVCGKSLDGIPFTVDATNQIHCIEDFHKKFAPRCCVCGYPIMPESGQEETVRIVAMDKSFHTACYTCEDCGMTLSSEAEGRGCYPLDDHILCKNCNARRIQAMTTKMTTEL